MTRSFSFFALLSAALVLATGCASTQTEPTMFKADEQFTSPIREGSVIYVERELPFPA